MFCQVECLLAMLDHVLSWEASNLIVLSGL